MLTLEGQTKKIEKREKQVSNLSSENRYLKRQREALKRKFFGCAASENISDEQFTLALAELEREQAEQVASEKEVIGYAHRKPSSGEAIAKLPDDIETETREIVPQEVLNDPDACERIGEIKDEGARRDPDALRHAREGTS